MEGSAMDRSEKIDEMTQAVAGFATGYAEQNGLTNGDIMDALGRLYVTYGFTVKTETITNEALAESLVGFVDAACNLMVEALRHAEEA
jgi:hypothetical protein